MRTSVNPGATKRAIVLASLPAVMLAVCPVLASPFESAKCSVLLVFGASACWIVREALKERRDLHLSDDSSRDSVLLVCLGAWATVLLATTVVVQGWAVGWRPLAEIGSAIGVAAAMMRLSVNGRSLVGLIATSSLVLSLVVLVGFFGFDMPWLFGCAAAPGRMRSAGTLGNPLFVASFLSSASFGICGWTRLQGVFRWAAVSAVLMALMATGERTALTGICAGAVCWLVCAPRRLRQRVLAAALIAFVMVALSGAVYLLNPRGVKAAAEGRVFLWRTSLHELSFIGKGVGGFYGRYAANLRDLAPGMPERSFRFVAYEDQAHNVLVQQIVEAGVAGAALFLGLISAWFWLAWKERGRIEVRAAMAGVAAIAGAGIFDNLLGRPEGLLLLACWMVLPLLRLDQAIGVPGERSHAEQSLGRGSARLLLAGCALALAFGTGISLLSSYATFAGERAEELVQWTRSQQWLRVAIAVDPAAGDARFDLVRVLCEAGEYESCLSESERALPWVNEAELHLLRVRAFEALGHADAAAKELAAARRQFPWSRDLRDERVSLPSNNSLLISERNR